SLGLHKNPELLKQVRDYEDRLLFGQATSAIYKDVNEPTTEQMVAYFNENKERFGISASIKIDPIWCNNLAEARKVRAELDAGKDFEQVKQQYSLEKKLKALPTRPGSETVFWKELWAADPNTIVGPVKGFYRQEGVKWRVVKILEKNPAEPKEYDEKMLPQIKDRMMSERRDALLAAYRKELLGKYTHHIYADKVKDIDVMDID
ncbi:MAG: peptidyl-prolyl cis-trans isomerase, partial [Phycisphaerales bacterium]